MRRSILLLQLLHSLQKLFYVFPMLPFSAKQVKEEIIEMFLFILKFIFSLNLRFYFNLFSINKADDISCTQV